MNQVPESRRQYQTPSIKVMDETEMLAAFQITSAGASWWW